MADYDLAIIGGGLNGVSIARDAAGRGLRVILLEQGDLGAGASSASPRLIHGDLAGLERRALLRVRTALAERDIWLRIAPHLVRPMRFAIPAHADERPAWQLRSWLLLYDRLASRAQLPRSATVDVTHHPIGNPLKRPFGTAFEYSDCVVDDSRLVVLTAVDAAARGAAIRTGARCTRAERGETWRLVTIDRGHRQVVTARALVNATGAWTATVAETVLRQPSPKPLARLGTVQMSQIVVRRLFDTDNVYVFQNSDRRLIFASPYERDFTLIGTVGHAFKGDPAIVAMAAGDVAYLCDAANRYFRERIEPVDVVRTVSGANMVMNPASRRQRRGRRDEFRPRRGKAPLITIFGGDVTTSRLRAEKAVSQLTPFYPMSRALDREGAVARRRFCLGPLRDRNRRGARALAVSRRGSGPAPGLGLWLERQGDPRRRQGARRSRPGLRAGIDGAEVRYLMRRRMGAFSGRYPVAALQARPDDAAGGSRRAGGVHGRGLRRAEIVPLHVLQFRRADPHQAANGRTGV